MTQQRPLTQRIAGAPISWGVCEAPGWGTQLPVDRVLGEMADLGLTETEFGADGWLPTELDHSLAALERHGLSPIGGFVPLILHDADRWPETDEAVRALIERFAAANAEMFVSCVVADEDWTRPTISDEEWDTLAANLGRVDAMCSEHGLTQVLHPHVDALIERVEEVDRILAATDVKLCLDTGHLAIGGAELDDFTKRWVDRVAHVHCKDVRMDVAERLNAGEHTLMSAVQAGMFVPLGTGDLPLRSAFSLLEAHGYDGWYVIEQDIAITDEVPAPHTGPYEDFATSLAWLRGLADGD